MPTDNLQGNGGNYATGGGNAPTSPQYLVFCPNAQCGEMSVMSPLYSCDKCEQGRHHDFLCPVCGARWNEFDKDLKPV